jgi:amino acid transporter
MTRLEVPIRTSGLRSECLSFPEVLAQSIANIAPTLTPTVNVALVFASSGAGTWFTYVLATIGLVFVGLNINQFARRSASPGSLYAYIARGLGPTAGVITGWALILAYVSTAMALVYGFANYGQVLFGPLGITPSPIFLFAICAGIAWYIAYRDIQLSTVVMLALEAASVLLILVLGLIIVGKKGYVIDASQLTMQGVKPGGIVLGLVLGVFSYVGFESATTLGDEAKRPLRNIPRAVIISTVISGLFFIFMSYIQVLGFQGLATTLDKSTAPLNDLANAAGVGFFGILISICAMISFQACILACINAGSRILFSMSRHGIFHGFLGQAHGRNETPHVAVTLISLLSFLVPTILSMAANIALLDGYGYFGTIATYGFLVAYILISIAAPVYLAREHQLRFKDILYSVLSVAFMAIPVLGSFGLPGETSLFPIPPAPYNVFPYWFLLYLAIGAGWFLVLRSRSPHVIRQMEEDIEATHTRFSDLKKV